MTDGYGDPGDPDGLYLSGKDPGTVHRGDCRYVARYVGGLRGYARDGTSWRASLWEWADGRDFADVRYHAELDGLRLCKVCKPAAGDGRVRSAGGWVTPFNGGHANPITHIAREGKAAPLEFDPPNILFIPGGTRIRLESYESDSPVLAVEGFDRSVRRVRMRPRLSVARDA